MEAQGKHHEALWRPAGKGAGAAVARMGHLHPQKPGVFLLQDSSLHHCVLAFVPWPGMRKPDCCVLAQLIILIQGNLQQSCVGFELMSCICCLWSLMCCLQGMSISKLVVNVQRSFAAGMVYVALSRCTSRDGLQVRTGSQLAAAICGCADNGGLHRSLQGLLVVLIDTRLDPGVVMVDSTACDLGARPRDKSVSAAPLPLFLQLQIVGDVPAPQSSDDVRSFYRYLFSIEPRDS
jgi:hypothetical protein